MSGSWKTCCEAAFQTVNAIDWRLATTPPATLAFAGRMATMVGLGGQGPVVLHNCIVTNVLFDLLEDAQLDRQVFSRGLDHHL